jgi:hypothetical protein
MERNTKNRKVRNIAQAIINTGTDLKARRVNGHDTITDGINQGIVATQARKTWPTSFHR